MSFINTRLDERIAAGFTSSPEWSTQVVLLDNGREVRNAQWLYPRHRYTAQYNNLDPTRREVVRHAFYAARGQLSAFRFKDWMDFSAANEAIAPTVGTSDPVQLVKTYSLGATAVSRLIQAPVAGSVVVKADGVAVAGTLDAGTGLFTPASPWSGSVFTWSGQFDVWVRFASDANAFTLNHLNAATADIELIEVRR